MAQDNSECRQAITEFYLEVDFLQTFNAAVNDGFRCGLTKSLCAASVGFWPVLACRTLRLIRSKADIICQITFDYCTYSLAQEAKKDCRAGDLMLGSHATYAYLLASFSARRVQ